MLSKSGQATEKGSQMAAAAAEMTHWRRQVVAMAVVVREQGKSLVVARLWVKVGRLGKGH